MDDLFGRPILLAGIIMDLLPDLKMRENTHETTNRVQWHKHQQTKAKVAWTPWFWASMPSNDSLSKTYSIKNAPVAFTIFLSAQITLEYCQIYCWCFCTTVHKKMLQKAHLASLSAFANSAAEMKTILTRLVNNQASQRIATRGYVTDLLTFSSVWL